LFYEQLDGIDEEEVEDILDEFGIWLWNLFIKVCCLMKQLNHSI
jgi:hypothetical protein